MRNVFDVIIAPVVTEKATTQQETENVYTFIVHKDANKHEIAEAVEAAWDVEVEEVWTARYPGKTRRSFLGRVSKNAAAGRRPGYKKALVRLAEGDSIELYEVG